MKNGRILVLGCGYVGRSVVRLALDAGFAVWALTRNVEKAAALRAAGCSGVIEADLAGYGWHEAARGRWTAVVNLVSSAGRGLAGYRHSYVEGNLSVLRWLPKVEVGRYLYSSSTSVYGQSGGVWVNEESETALASETGQVLLEAEATALGARLGTVERSAVVLRLAGLYGPGRHRFLDRLRRPGALLEEEKGRYLNLLHREDAARAVMQVVMRANGENGVFNVADGAPATRGEMAAWMRAEGFVDETEATGGEGATGKRSPGSRVNPAGEMPNRRVSSERFRNVFAWSPLYPDFRSGYRALLEEERA